MGTSGGLKDFWDLLLGRMFAVEQPVFVLNELSGVGDDFMSQMLQRRVLIKSPMPEMVLDSKGRELCVHKTENGIIGVDESDDIPRFVDLSEADVTHFGLGVAGLAAELCSRNEITPVKPILTNGLLHLGSKVFSGNGDVPVFLVLGTGASGAEGAMLSLSCSEPLCGVKMCP